MLLILLLATGYLCVTIMHSLELQNRFVRTTAHYQKRNFRRCRKDFASASVGGALPLNRVLREPIPQGGSLLGVLTPGELSKLGL